MICHDTFLHCFVQSMCPASYKVKENGERHFLRTPWINHRSFHHSLAQVVSNLSCEPSFDFSPGREWTGMDRRNSPRCLRVSHTAQHSCAAADVVGFIPGMPPQCCRVTPTVSFFSMIEWQLSLLDEPNHVGYIIPIYIYIIIYIHPDEIVYCISSHVYPHFWWLLFLALHPDPKLSPRGIFPKSFRTCSHWPVVPIASCWIQDSPRPGPAALSIALKLTRSWNSCCHCFTKKVIDWKYLGVLN